jgi:outer membrane protein W
MKKLLFVAALVAVCGFAQAQSPTFKPFKVDVAVGYAVPDGHGAKAGLVFAVEPKYVLNDKFTIGLRMEAAATARAYVDNNGYMKSADVKASGSYLATGDYYFSTNKFRPFAGIGAGVFSLAAASIDDSGEEVSAVASSTRFGAAPRIGFEFGHFRTAVEYNIVGKVGKISNNYIGIKAGFFIGGGRLEK